MPLTAKLAPIISVARRRHQTGEIFLIHQPKDGPFLAFQFLDAGSDSQWGRIYEFLADAKRDCDDQAHRTHSCETLKCQGWATVNFLAPSCDLTVMNPTICPRCHDRKIRQVDVSRFGVTQADYYCCEFCGHGWMIPKETYLLPVAPPSIPPSEGKPK